MSLVTDPNYTAPNAATYHNADTDVYSRTNSYTNTLIDLLAHDHRTSHGLAAGRLTSTAIAATANTGECQVVTGGLKITDGTTQNTLTDVANNGAADFKCLGLTGATAASRWVGATTSGAPTSGTFSTGDWITTQDGNFYLCTAGGSPGTWRRIGVTPGSDTGYTGTSDPVGGFLEDGRAISRTAYAAAFGVTSTTYGSGDGSTTFNIPDVRDRATMGPDNMGTSQGAAGRASGNVALGNSSGEDTHTLTSGESGTAAHNHSASATSTDSGHSHPSPSGHFIVTGSTGGPASPGTSGVDGGASTGTGTASISTSVTVNNAAGASASSAHNNRQLTLVMNRVYWT